MARAFGSHCPVALPKFEQGCLTTGSVLETCGQLRVAVMRQKYVVTDRAGRYSLERVLGGRLGRDRQHGPFGLGTRTVRLWSPCSTFG